MLKITRKEFERLLIQTISELNGYLYMRYATVFNLSFDDVESMIYSNSPKWSMEIKH